jgi:Protein of unknown function with HXXEE motif
MDDGYRFRSWFVDYYGWARMSLPFAVLTLASLPIFSVANNLSLILLYTLLPVYMIHQYEEHAHGRFVDFFNSTIGKEYDVLTKISAFWINILEVWVLFIVSFYMAKYVAIGVAFVPVYATVLNGLTHAIASIVLKRYNPGLYTALVLFFPWGIFLLIYFNGITRGSLLFNGVGLLAGILLHAIIVIYALKRRSKLETHSRGGAEANP